MAGDLHQTIVNLIQDAPELSASLLARAAPEVYPPTEHVRAETACNEVGSRMTTERSADNVVKLAWPDGYSAVVICETQNEWSDQKYLRLPGYLARAFEDHGGCDVEVLMICASDRLAARYRDGIRLNRRTRFFPLALSPSQFELLSDPEAPGASAEMAAVALLLNRKTEPDMQVISTLDALLAKIDATRGAQIAEAVMALRGGVAQTLLEEIMTAQTYEYHSEFADRLRAEGRDEGRDEGRAEGRFEGRAEGRAEGATGEARRMFYLAVEGLGLTLSRADRERVEACQDPMQIERWLRKALKASTSAELFRD